MKQSTTNTKNTKKYTFFFLLVVGVFVIVLLFLGMYFVIRTSSVGPTQLVKTTQSLSPAIPNWLTFESDNKTFKFQYPKSWSVRSYDPFYGNSMYKDHAVFSNMQNVQDEVDITTPSERIFGEVKVLGSNALRGEPYRALTKDEFFDPESSFWLVGTSIGGGPGYTNEIPTPIKIGKYDMMIQSSHPNRRYEFVFPEQITNSYYYYINGNPTEILYISVTYDSRYEGIDKTLAEFHQILSTLEIR